MTTTTRALPQSKKAKAPFVIDGEGEYQSRAMGVIRVAPGGSEAYPWKVYDRNDFVTTVRNDGYRWSEGDENRYDIVARVTKSPARPLAKPKAARQYVVRDHSTRRELCFSYYGVEIVTGGIIGTAMTRSTARKLAALLNGEGA